MKKKPIHPMELMEWGKASLNRSGIKDQFIVDVYSKKKHSEQKIM